MSVHPLRRWLGLLAGASVLFLFAVAASAADEFPVTPAQVQALGVQVLRLERPAEIEGQTFPARVVLPPRQQQVVSAPLAGVVDQLLVNESETVKPGQALIRLVSPELGTLQLALMEASSRGQLAVRTLERERQLSVEGIIPQRRVQEAEAAAAEAAARRRQAEAALRLAGADDGLIRRVAAGGALESALTLRARTGGLVVTVDAKPGQRVQPADALLGIADTRTLWLDIQVPVAQQGAVASSPSAPVTVVGREAAGRTTSVATWVSDSQGLTVRAEVTRGASLLRPGEFVQVRVPFAAGAGDGWALPIGAVVRQGKQAYVFVRTPAGFVATPVKVVASAGENTRVQGPLKAGQEVATKSVIALKAAWQGKGGSN